MSSQPQPAWLGLLRLLWVYVRLLAGAVFKRKWLRKCGPGPKFQSVPMPRLPPAEATATLALSPHKLEQYKKLVGWGSTGHEGQYSAETAEGQPSSRAAEDLKTPLLQRPQTVGKWGPCVLPAVFLVTDAFPLVMEVLAQLPFSVMGTVVNKRATHRLLRPELPPATPLMHRVTVTRDARLTAGSHAEFDICLTAVVARTGVVVYEATLTLVLLRQGGVKKKASLSVPAPDQAVPTSENAGGDGGGLKEEHIHPPTSPGAGGVIHRLSDAAKGIAPAAASTLLAAAAPDVAGMLQEMGGEPQGKKEGAEGKQDEGAAAASQAGKQQVGAMEGEVRAAQPAGPEASGSEATGTAAAKAAAGGKSDEEISSVGGGSEQLPPKVGGFKLGSHAGRAWAALDGDVSPMHLWAWTAKLSGFPRPVANVQLLLGSTESVLRSRGLIPPSITPVQISAEFKRPCLLPNELAVHAATAGGTAGTTSGSTGAGGEKEEGGGASSRAGGVQEGSGMVEFVVASAKDGRPFAVGRVAWGAAARG